MSFWSDLRVVLSSATEVIIGGDIVLEGGGYIKSTLNGDIDIDPHGTGIVGLNNRTVTVDDTKGLCVGAGSPSYATLNGDDLYVLGQVEIGSTLDVVSVLTTHSNALIYSGASIRGGLYVTGATVPNYTLHSNANRTLAFVDWSTSRLKDTGLADLGHPSIALFSVDDPEGGDNQLYGRFCFEGTDFRIRTGASAVEDCSIFLAPRGVDTVEVSTGVGVNIGNHTAARFTPDGDDLLVAGYIETPGHVYANNLTSFSTASFRNIVEFRDGFTLYAYMYARNNYLGFGLTSDSNYSLAFLNQAYSLIDHDINAVSGNHPNTLWFDGSDPAVGDNKLLYGRVWHDSTYFVIGTGNHPSTDNGISIRPNDTETARFIGAGGFRWVPKEQTGLVAASTITPNAVPIEVQANSGATPLTSTPTIPDGVDGQIIELIGLSDTDTVIIQDESVLAGSNILLTYGPTYTLNTHSKIELKYSASQGAWVEWDRSDSSIPLAEAYTHENTTAEVCAAADTWQPIIAVDTIGENCCGFTFTTGATVTIASVADAGGGDITVTTSSAHGYSDGDIVALTNTTTYDEVYVISNASGSVFDVTATWGATSTGNAIRASALTVGDNSDGIYDISWEGSAASSSPGDTFDVSVFHNTTHENRSEQRYDYVQASTFTAATGGMYHNLVSGDKVAVFVKCIGGTGNITFRYLNFRLSRKCG